MRNTYTAYCMTEDFTISEVAEPKKQINEQARALINEVKSYVGSQAQLLEELETKTKLIQQQKVTIYDLTRKVRLLETENINLQRGTSIAGLKSAEYTEISDLHRSFLTHVHSLREDLNVLKNHIANAEKSVEDIFDAEKESTKRIRNIQERFWDGHNKDFSVYPRFG